MKAAFKYRMEYPMNDSSGDDGSFSGTWNEEGQTYCAGSNWYESDDADSLRQYFRHLGDSDPLTAEEELSLWNQMDQFNLQRRHELYQFGFVLPEHIKVLSDCTADNLSDVFPQASLPDEAQNPNYQAAMLLKIAPWKERIARQYMTMKKAFTDASGTLPALRESSVALLMEYPVTPELLNEWQRVAAVYLMNLGIDLKGPSAQKLVSDSPVCKELEERVLMSADDFVAAMKRLDAVDRKAEDCKSRILTANLRLVVSLVKHYRNSRVQMGDLIQEGNLGLIHAMDKFDYTRGHKFSTYATWWIKRFISKAVASQSRVIRLPTHMLQSIAKINHAEQNFMLVNGRDPSDEELAAILELPRERVSAIKKMTCQAISLQAPVSSDENGALLENLIAEGDSDDPTKKLAFKMMCSRLKKALDTLSEREQQIIRLRFGLDGTPPKTLIEVSKIFNLTRERIRQLEIRAIKKLRDPALSIYFQDYFE